MYEGKYSHKAVRKRSEGAHGGGRVKKKSGREPLRRIIFLLSTAVTLYALVRLGGYIWGSVQSLRQNDQLAQLAVQTLPSAPQEASAAEKEETAQQDQAGPAKTPEGSAAPRETAPIRVDFEALKKEAPDIIAWLYCPDTPINYPVMCSKNNQDYIRSLPDGTPNSAGSLFLDYRLNQDFAQQYSVIYGHNMKNDTMFGILDEYKKQDFLDAHSALYLITETAAYRVELMAGIVISGSSQYYQLPMDPAETQVLIQQALERSFFQGNASGQEGPYLVLSTCDYSFDDARLLIFGVMSEIDME